MQQQIHIAEEGILVELPQEVEHRRVHMAKIKCISIVGAGQAGHLRLPQKIILYFCISPNHNAIK
jgi:hypothetical protein